MKRLQKLITHCKLRVLHGGRCPLLTELSTNYNSLFNIGPPPFSYKEKISPAVGMAIADAYEQLDHEPDNPLVSAAYEQLAKELINQYAYLTHNEKIIFEPYEGQGEPYANSVEMLMDIHNYHMYFFKTEAGFGERTPAKNNIMLRKTGFFAGKYELCVNDIFRIVHDIFGHAMHGFSFGPVGEDQAWFTHLTMFSPLAAAALTIETRGQNCWVNFGKHLRDENNHLYTRESKQYLAPPERPFAEQKMNILPSAVSGIELFLYKDAVAARYLTNWNPMQTILNVAI